MILTTIVTHSGIESLREAEFTNFRTNLEIMQAQVNLLSEKYKDEIKEASQNGVQFTGVGESIPTSLFADIGGVESFLGEVKLVDNSIKSINSIDYRYFGEKTLKEMQIEYEDTEYLVDFKNRIVIATKPVKYEKTLYYTLNQIKGKPTTGGLTRTNVTVGNVTYRQIQEGYEITLENIQCSKYVTKYDVKYKKADDSTYKVAGQGVTGTNYSFEVREAGVYEILIIDAAECTTEGLVINIEETTS